MYSVAFSIALPPLSNVWVSIYASPHTRPMFVAFHPLSLIELSIAPLVLPDTMRLVVLICAYINTRSTCIRAPIGQSFKPITSLPILPPLPYITPSHTFINSSIIIEHNTFPLPLAFPHFSIIHGILIPFKLQFLRDMERVNGDNFALRLVGAEVLH